MASSAFVGVDVDTLSPDQRFALFALAVADRELPGLRTLVGGFEGVLAGVRVDPGDLPQEVP